MASINIRRALFALILSVTTSNSPWLASCFSAEPTIKSGSTAVVILSDNTTVVLRFTVAPDGKITAIGALARDSWFQPVINADATPGPNPPPEPPVPPVPPVPPIPPTPPAVQKIQIVVVEETADSTPDQAAIRNSKPIRDWTANGGHRLFFLDPQDRYTGEGANSWQSWLDLAKDKKLPQIFLVPVAGGEILYKGDCPATVADFQKLIETYGGKTPAGKAGSK